MQKKGFQSKSTASFNCQNSDQLYQNVQLDYSGKLKWKRPICERVNMCVCVDEESIDPYTSILDRRGNQANASSNQLPFDNAFRLSNSLRCLWLKTNISLVMEQPIANQFGSCILQIRDRGKTRCDAADSIINEARAAPAGRASRASLYFCTPQSFHFMMHQK